MEEITLVIVAPHDTRTLTKNGSRYQNSFKGKTLEKPFIKPFKIKD